MKKYPNSIQEGVRSCCPLAKRANTAVIGHQPFKEVLRCSRMHRPVIAATAPGGDERNIYLKRSFMKDSHKDK